MPIKNSISACIVCRNEAEKLLDCLNSIKWVDEILLMDLESSDGSAQIASDFGAKVVSRQPHPIVEPLRNELAQFVTSNWILALDPDERVTEGLAERLQEIALVEDIDAVVIPRTNIDLGYAPSHPIQRFEPQLRMYRPDRITWPNFPNKLPKVPLERKYVIPANDKYALIHLRNRNVPETVERIMRYAPAQAASMLEAGETFSASNMLVALFKQTDKEFFQARAWDDGVPGLLRASILVIYKFYVWTAMWQQAGSLKTKQDDRLIRLLGLFMRVLWIFPKFALKAAGWISRLKSAFKPK